MLSTALHPAEKRQKTIALEGAAIAALQLGDPEKISRYVKETLAASYLPQERRETLRVWNSILVSDAKSEEFADQDAKPGAIDQQDALHLYRLALGQVLAGKTEDASRTLQMALDRDESLTSAAMPYLIQAEIAKQYGLKDLVPGLMTRVEAGIAFDPDGIWIAALLKKRSSAASATAAH